MLLVLLVVAGCTHAPQAAHRTTTTTHPKLGSPQNPEAPSFASVSKAAYVDSVTVGGGIFEVSPPPKDSYPSVSAADAMAIFDSDAAFTGTYGYDILGLGVATLNPSAAPTPSTTTTAPTTTAPTTSTPTTSGSTPTTSAPTTTTTPQPTFPSYDKRLSWVGIAVDQSTSSCDAPGMVVVMMDADTGHDVVSITIAGCDSSTAPVVAAASQLQSVAWTPVGSTSTSVSAQIPACGTYVGWTDVNANGTEEVQIQASGPYDPQCSNPTATSATIPLVVPTGSGQATVPHAPTGPIDNLQSLVSSTT